MPGRQILGARAGRQDLTPRGCFKRQEGDTRTLGGPDREQYLPAIGQELGQPVSDLTLFQVAGDAQIVVSILRGRPGVESVRVDGPRATVNIELTACGLGRPRSIRSDRHLSDIGRAKPR